MNRKKVMIKGIIIGFLILLAPAFVMAQMPPLKVKVDCNKGQSLQSALDKLTGPATFVVTGTCYEYLDITKDDVTIQGGNYQEPSPPDPAQSIFYVLSARRVLITGVTVIGGSNGIYVDKGGSLTLAGNSTISGAINNGVASVLGSSVTVNSSTIQDNSQGILVNDNSALTLTNSIITANDGAGVQVQRSSSARIGRSMAGVSGPNTITNNGGNGVNVYRSAYALIDGNTITGNSGSGISIDGASCTVTSNTISFNKSWAGVNVGLASNVRIGVTEGPQYAGNTINDNYGNGIFINSGSSAYIGGNTIKGNGIALNPSYGTYGIFLVNAIADLFGSNIITENNGCGVFAWGSRVRIGDAYTGMSSHNTISGNGTGSSTTIPKGGVYGFWGTSLAITDAEINNNIGDGIKLSACSNVLFPGGSTSVTVTGNTLFGLQCGDANFCSRFGGNIDGISGNTGGDVSPNCTGF